MGYEIDFLPVGEEGQSGDAVLLRYGNLHGDRREQTVVVVDGGFRTTGAEILAHLDTYYQTRVIDVVISTHPDADHINGLQVLVEAVSAGELRIRELWMHRPSLNRTAIERAIRKAADTPYYEAMQRTLDAAESLEDAANEAGIPIQEPFTGLSDGGSLVVVGPTRDFYSTLFEEEAETAAEESRLMRWLGAAREFIETVAEDWDFETLRDDGTTSPVNNSSVILMLQVNDGYCLLTADAGQPALNLAADVLAANGYGPERLRFMQVPHHGSRRNVGPTVLNRLLGPRRATDEPIRTAFVSVAQKGAPKHPAKKVTNAFRRRGSPVHATAGAGKRQFRDAPDRGWSASTPLPFYDTVEE